MRRFLCTLDGALEWLTDIIVQTIGESRLLIAAVLLEAGKWRMKMFVENGQIPLFKEVVTNSEWVRVALRAMVRMVTLFAFSQGDRTPKPQPMDESCNSPERHI